MIGLLALMLASAAPATSAQPGARVDFRVSARIVRDSASVGPDLAAPIGSHRREARLSAADGTPVAAIVYDFE